MDGITQGLIGAVASQSVYARALGRPSFLIGFGAGLLADAGLRGMTHALIFIPLGGLLAALPFLLVPRLRRRWRQVAAAAILGYATHGVLDALTADGTQLYWPFSDHRVSADIMPVIDPFFSLTLLAGTLWATVKRSTRPARIALAIAIAYILFAALQHHRAASAQEQLIAARGHQAEQARVHPTPLTVLLHRSIYIAGGRTHVDAIRTPLLGAPTYRPGDSTELSDPFGRDLDLGGHLREVIGADDRHKALPDPNTLPAARAPLPIDEGAGARSATMLALAGDCEAGFPASGRLACRQACDLGHSNSCARLASHLESDGGADELAAALHLHLEACSGGSGLGCEAAAAMFARGAGGPADPDRAAELYRGARIYHRVHCEQRFAPSCAAAARLFARGLGGPADPAVAGDYARRACDLGLESACAGRRGDL